MSSRHIPYFDFYPADFMHGVRGLTAQEVGVYTMMLCRIYEDNGPVEYHVKRLATYCGMRESKFQKTLETLIELGKLDLINGMISNRRAEAEISSRANKLEINSKAGKESAKKRQRNQSSFPTDVQRTFNHTDTDTDTDTLSSVSTRGHSDNNFDRLAAQIEEAGKGKIQPHSLLVLGPIIELIASGVSLQLDVLPTVTAVSSRLNKTVNLSYFIGPIREAYERRVSAGQSLPAPAQIGQSDADWMRRLRYARLEKKWSSPEWGPMPPDTGCKVPTHLLEKTDGDGWTDTLRATPRRSVA